MKCDAHQKGEDKITLGNNFADQTAKAAAKRETEPGKGILVLTRAQIAKKRVVSQVTQANVVLRAEKIQVECNLTRQRWKRQLTETLQC